MATANRVGEQIWCIGCCTSLVEQQLEIIPKDLDDEELLHYLDEAYPDVDVPYWYRCEHCGESVTAPWDNSTYDEHRN
jgi:hypothetical protein